MDQKKPGAETRLRKLAVDLKKAYAHAAKYVGEALSPVEMAVAEIGETWKPAHFAETYRDRGRDAAVRPPTCFAHETFINGDEADYLLCVGQGPDRKCGLYVSICRYRIGPAPADGNGGSERGEVAIKNMPFTPVSSLPVPLRLKIIDVLDAFAAGYEEHVREVRKGLLQEWHDSGAPAVETPAPEPAPAQNAEENPAGADDPLGLADKNGKSKLKFAYSSNGN